MIRIGELKDEAIAVLNGKWSSFVGLTFVYMLIAMVIAVPSNAASLMQGSFMNRMAVILTCVGVVISFLMVPMHFGYYLAHMNASRQDMPAEIGDLFACYPNILKIIGTYLLLGVICVVGFALLIVPGIIFALMYSMVPFILIDNPEMSILDAFKKSREMMYGHKLYYLLLNLSFLGWMLLAILSFGLGLLWLMPYMNMTEFKFYEHLCKEDSQEEFIDFVKDTEMA